MKDGLLNACKSCVKRDAAARNKANPAQNRIAVRNWRKNNPEAQRALNRRSDRKRQIAHQIATYGKEVLILEMTHDRYRAARALGFRSGLEVQIAKQLDDNGIAYEYEAHTIRYTIPEETHRFSPDFVLPNYIVIEGKGEFTSADRKKIAFVREQHPNIDLRFVFSNSKARIGKKSKTTYGMWCTKHGIPFSDKLVPAAWWCEPLNEKSQAACEAAINVH